MTEAKNTNVSKIEEIYSKYFVTVDDINAVYHRIGKKEMYVSIALVPESQHMDPVERSVRKALGYGSSNGRGILDDVRSILANLPKLKNESLKKDILFYFRNLFGSDPTVILHKRATIRAAIANKLATSYDYLFALSTYSSSGSVTNRNVTKDYLFNCLVQQAKLDIKSEMALDVPDYFYISNICERVKDGAKMAELPTRTLSVIYDEFDADMIIAGGNHIQSFESSIELQLANLDKVKLENSQMKDKLIEAAKSAETMQPSLCSVGVIKHKMFMKDLVANIR